MERSSRENSLATPRSRVGSGESGRWGRLFFTGLNHRRAPPVADLLWERVTQDHSYVVNLLKVMVKLGA
jgi:hypothetical protein